MNKRTQPKPERDARVYRYYLEHGGGTKGGVSIAAIGRMYRMSREWARQIIKREKEKEVIHENREP